MNEAPGAVDRPISPWALFLLFLTVHSTLTYIPLSSTEKILLLVLGLLLPLAWAFKATPSSGGNSPLFDKDPIPLRSCWVLFFGISLLVFLRFYRLETLFRWPTLDEGWNGTLALLLSRHWTWRFFYTFGQAPPLPVWTAAALLKLGYSPFLSLWIPSAVVSCLTVGAGYFASREFFSKIFSVLLGGLLAFSFWPLYMGRFCHQGIWLPLWVCSSLFLLGRLRNSRGLRPRNFWALALGLTAGLGSFTFTPWVAVAFLLGLTLLALEGADPKKNLAPFGLFLLGSLLGLLPFLNAVLKEGYGQHILSVTAWSGWTPLSNQFSVVSGYLSSLFWGPLQDGSAYTPTGGGFLNPLLDAFFFLGFLEALRYRKDGRVKWILIAFPFFLLPGLLSMNVETFRVAQILPLSLWFCALGAQSLAAELPSGGRTGFLVLALAISLGLDGSRLAAPYADDSKPRFPEVWPVKSMERYRAFQLLGSMSRWSGPGWVFTHFDPDSFNDPTLSLAATPFNAAENAAIPAAKARWAAVFVNAHYRSFLSRRFPEAKWFWVGKDQGEEDGGKALGIIPLLPGNEADLRHWAEVYAFFRRADLLRFWQNKEDFNEVIRTLEGARPDLKGDPFLESVYWEKMAAYEYGNLDYDRHLLALQTAVQGGYPAAHLYYQLGVLLATKNRLSEARLALEKANQSAFNQTPSLKMTRVLDELEKTGLSLRDLYRLRR